MYVPKKLFLTKGVGRHKKKLASFEMALRNAGIQRFNLVHVSSILPPLCKIINREEGLKELLSGQIVHCVMARNETQEPGRQIAASIGIAIPSDRVNYGYLSEHKSFGENVKQASDFAEDLAAEMLATSLDIDFDEDADYDEKREIWKMDERIYRTTAMTQSSIGDRKGKWTTVIAAAVLIL